MSETNVQNAPVVAGSTVLPPAQSVPPVATSSLVSLSVPRESAPETIRQAASTGRELEQAKSIVFRGRMDDLVISTNADPEACKSIQDSIAKLRNLGFEVVSNGSSRNWSLEISSLTNNNPVGVKFAGDLAIDEKSIAQWLEGETSKMTEKVKTQGPLEIPGSHPITIGTDNLPLLAAARNLQQLGYTLEMTAAKTPQIEIRDRDNNIVSRVASLDSTKLGELLQREYEKLRPEFIEVTNAAGSEKYGALHIAPTSERGREMHEALRTLRENGCRVDCYDRDVGEVWITKDDNVLASVKLGDPSKVGANELADLQRALTEALAKLPR